ncbi:MAG: 3-phosphoserine/phosphohydroxythreonine transaminase [Acidobacteria bacterium]|nr:3-phosphoserine/phosphohydroxythreonine transaminase [Acidobacteriota bacterium]
MAKRVYNFYPGPATLPWEVVQEASQGVLEFQGLGLSIMEISHRSKEFDQVIKEAAALVKELLEVPDHYHVLFLQGGSSLQFAMVPMNFLPADGTADYINTGAWSKKAIKEAKFFGNVNVAASSEDRNFSYIPDMRQVQFTPGAAYVHITSNNTIFGTQYDEFPNTGDVPLMADMCSDFMWRKFDINRFALVYASAQKNMGPAGVTIAIIRDDLLPRIKNDVPTMLNYKIHAEKESLYNTPPCVAVYVVNLMLKWIKNRGGLGVIESTNRRKAAMLYDTIDELSGFYRGTVEPANRSHMNITFRLPSEDLEKQFIAEATAQDLVGLKGHRSVGGCRASLYNGFPMEGVERLVNFMREFARKNG